MLKDIHLKEDSDLVLATGPLHLGYNGMDKPDPAVSLLNLVDQHRIRSFLSYTTLGYISDVLLELGNRTGIVVEAQIVPLCCFNIAQPESNFIVEGAA